MSTFAIEFNGLTINETSGYNINLADGIDDLPIRTSQFNLTGDHGGVVDAQKYGMRVLGLRGTIYGTTVSDYFEKKADLLRAFCVDPDDRTLTVTNWNGTSRSTEAYVLQQPRIVLKTGEVTFADFSLVLICPEPFWASDSATTYTINLSESGGTPVSSPVPSPVGSGTSDRATVINSGDIDSFASFTISGACTNPTVSNLTTGESFQLTGTYLAGDVVTIDKPQAGLSVLKNGSNIMSSFTGTFFKMAVGNNIIRFTSSVYNSATELEIVFYDKYLTIE